MANSLNTNPIIVDTTGVIKATPIEINAINIAASANAWAVVLHDAASGNIIFSSASAIAGDRGCCSKIGPTRVAGIYATTLTNITNIQIFGYSEA